MCAESSSGLIYLVILIKISGTKIGSRLILLNYPAVVQGPFGNLSHTVIGSGSNVATDGGSVSCISFYNTIINNITGPSGCPCSIAHISRIGIFNVIDYHSIVVASIV
jgi:hypothetical protein